MLVSKQKLLSKGDQIMQAEMLSVGTELLLGEIVDTNSAWLANELSQQGVDVLWSQRVGDNLERIKSAIELALSRSDVVLMCGGLGPTDDDMTREAIAAVAGETPVVDAELENTLRDLFARFSREMPEKNLKQAWLIPSAVSLANPNGTAPGWFVTLNRDGAKKVVVALPGPPRELKPMWSNEVVPRLDMPSAVFYAKIFKTFDIGESTLAEVLGDDLTQSSNPSVATYAKQDGVHVRVAAKGANQVEAQAIAAPALAEVEEKLAGHVWGTDDDNLAKLVIEKLTASAESLSVVEVASGGHISNMLLAAAKSLKQESALRGAVLINNQVTAAKWGITERLGDEATAELLAKKVQSEWQSDCSLAIGSIEDAVSEAGTAAKIVNIAAYQNGKVLKKDLRMPSLSFGWQKERIALAGLVLLLELLG